MLAAHSTADGPVGARVPTGPGQVASLEQRPSEHNPRQFECNSICPAGFTRCPGTPAHIDRRDRRHPRASSRRRTPADRQARGHRSRCRLRTTIGHPGAWAVLQGAGPPTVGVEQVDRGALAANVRDRHVSGAGGQRRRGPGPFGGSGRCRDRFAWRRGYGHRRSCGRPSRIVGRRTENVGRHKNTAFRAVDGYRLRRIRR
jgi:hypothetical protein